ncbi:MAG: hypothetical protein LBI12_04090 [Treponema sp.]|jgi:Pyruvate/2-oxoacid:ferredoxin oxidoreductase delta subunit|nr:hypothetical protein [Treponema sp.]
MKPKIDDKKCGAGKDICKIIKNCPVGAVAYTEVDEPIYDRNVDCNCVSSDTEKSTNDADCGCSGGCADDINGCGGSPYSRIIIDYSKCNGCGICAEMCCGNAVNMIE